MATTWRMQLNRPCAAVMWPYVKLFGPLIIVLLSGEVLVCVVICLEQGANDLHMVQLRSVPPIISCSSKIQIGLPFWCQPTKVVLEKRLLNGCSSSSIFSQKGTFKLDLDCPM